MIILIAAVAKNNCIGVNNDLPWNIPEDLQHYKKITKGQTILMGQKTFQSILARNGKPLPGRKTIVVTKNKGFKTRFDTEIRFNLEEVLDEYKNSDSDLYVSGGASIYRQSIQKADELIITHVDKIIEGDTFFPNIDPRIWKIASEDKRNGFTFALYIKNT